MSYISEVLADSPRGFWLLDEASGNALDSSGNAHPLTVATLSQGVSGIIPNLAPATCYDLPGTGKLSAVDAAWNQLTTFTFEVWAKFDAVNSFRCLGSKDRTAGGWAFYITDGKLNAFFPGSGGTHLGATTIAAGSTLRHLVMTYGAGTAKVYLDGVLDGTFTGLSFTAANQEFRIGYSHGSNDGDGFAFFFHDGKMQAAALYPAVLSGTRIAAHYTAGLAAPGVAPSTPTITGTNPDPTSIAFTWNTPAGVPTGYEVRIDGGTAVDVGNVHTHTFTGLTPSTAYTLEVRAYNAIGTSGWASIGESTDAVPPPTALHIITATDTTLDLGWTPGAGVDGSEVRIDGGTVIDVDGDTSYLFAGLSPDTSYTLEVRSYIGASFSGWVTLAADTHTDEPAAWTANIIVGSHSWVINYDDVLDPSDPIQVLDLLTTSWEVDEGDPWPAQPRPASGRVGFYTADVANLADVGIGTPMAFILENLAGDVIATFHGRVAQQSARIIKRPSGMYLLYDFAGVDYTVDLAELPVTIGADWPAEGAAARFARITAACEAAGSAPITAPVDVGTAAFEAYTATTTNAATLLEDHLGQIAVMGDAGLERTIVVPVVTPDDVTLDHYECVPLARAVDASLLPGTFDVVGGVFTIIFPNMGANGIVDACDVDIDVQWNRLKYRAANRVTVAGDTVTAEATRPGPPVRLSLETTLTDQDAADAMAELYLPDVDESNGWIADTFRLYADRHPEAITPPWFPDHREDPPETFVYVMPIALVGIPAAVNLAGDLVYAGQLVNVTLTLDRRKFVVDYSLRRQLPQSTGDDAASWDWAKDAHPTVAWDDIDPGLSWYEARLARRP